MRIKSIRVFTALAGITIALYFSFTSIYRERFDTFNFAMSIVGVLLITAAIILNKICRALAKLPKIFQRIIKYFFAVFVCSVLIIESIIIYNMKNDANKNADYVIVLGCQVHGSIPSIPLSRRVNTAVRYLKENVNTKVVVTGGQGNGEDISEAEMMEKILIRNGIERQRILIENKATSTIENLTFSDTLYNLSDKNVVIVSSDYHLFRALAIAKKLGYNNVHRLAAASQRRVLPAYLSREYIAVVYYLILRRI